MRKKNHIAFQAYDFQADQIDKLARMYGVSRSLIIRAGLIHGLPKLSEYSDENQQRVNDADLIGMALQIDTERGGRFDADKILDLAHKSMQA